MEKLDVLSSHKESHRRRNSYSAAMEGDNAIQESVEIPQLKSIVARSYNQKKKLGRTASIESGTFSETSTNSRTIHPGRTRTPSWDIMRSTSTSEIEVPEVLLSFPDITTKLLRSHYILQKIVWNHQCNCRKESVISNRESFSSFSIKRRDSAFSVSTCQSLIAPSSGINSTSSLNRCAENKINYDVIYEDAEDYQDRPRRRHSDQTQPKINLVKNKSSVRRFSDQSPLRNLQIENPPVVRLKDEKCTREKIEISGSMRNEFANLKKDPRIKKNNERKYSEVSIGSLRRDSTNSITPKMMRRRFSEQLILEGGLCNEPEFDELIEDPEAEDSLTALNARKKVTLKRHYYPEGEWGFIVMIVVMCVQIISHGLQTSWGVLMTPAVLQYGKSEGETGRQLLNHLFNNL